MKSIHLKLKIVQTEVWTFQFNYCNNLSAVPVRRVASGFAESVVDSDETLQCDRLIWMVIWSEWLVSMICFCSLTACQLILKHVITVFAFPLLPLLSSIHHCFSFASVLSVSHSPMLWYPACFFQNSSCSHKRLHFLSLPWELVPCQSLKSYESKYKGLCVRDLKEQFFRVKSFFPLIFV